MPSRGIVAFMLVVLALVGCTSSEHNVVVLPAPQPGQVPGEFLAVWRSPSSPDNVTFVDAFSATDGRRLGDVAVVPSVRGATVQNLTRTSDGSVWLTLASGPLLVNKLGETRPDSCTATVSRLDTRDHQLRPIFRTPASVQVLSAVPNPNGTRLAYVAQPCGQDSDAHLVVRDLTSGVEHTIGAFAPRCHAIGTPSWSADGAHLAFVWWPADPSQANATNPSGTGCLGEPLPGQIATVAWNHTDNLSPADLIAPDPGCGYQSAVLDTDGLVGVETCGLSGLGAVHLHQIAANGARAASIDLPPRADPVTLASDAFGQAVLVDEYQAPAPGPGQPADYIETLDHGTLRLVARYDNGLQSVREGTW